MYFWLFTLLKHIMVKANQIKLPRDEFNNKSMGWTNDNQN